MAIAIDRAARLGVASTYPAGSIVVCSFGDASVNHSTAQGAFNSACWAAYQHLPVPVLFVCEDNGLGISVRTPPSWIEQRMRDMPGLIYRKVDGCDLAAAWSGAQEAVEICRQKRTPVFLHMLCERLWGHAGSDVDTEYRTPDEIRDVELRDPIALTAQGLLESGACTAAQLREVLVKAQERIRKLSAEAVRRPKLTSRSQIMAPIAPEHPNAVAIEARRANYGPLPVDSDRLRPLGQAIRMALADLMQKYPQMLIFGEDVAQKGGVYGVTLNLWRQFGAKRVFNTLLDEQTILGLAIGAGQAGLLPVPEIQFLAYVHNAEDQLRGEASSLSFFSQGQLKNPMVVRVAGLGYQKGFGGHFHNDNSLAVLRDLPGVIVAVPSRGDDAAKMLRTCMAAAKVDGRVCLFIEPIALYPVRDLFPEDGKWSFALPPQDQAIDLGEVGVYGADGRNDLVIFTYGNGVPMCLRARERLTKKGIAARIVDLRWIAPLPEAAIRLHAAVAPRVLVVDECRRSGSISEAIGASLFENAATRHIQFGRITAADSFIPLADASKLVLPDEEEIYSAAVALCENRSRAPGEMRTGTR
jgi:2-oxoisovalerate dehydrogenase E1 component